MSWNVKYRLEIKDISEGVNWKVDILEDAFSGSITNLTAGADPIKFNWENQSDDVFSPIKESKLTLTIVTAVDFVLQDLYSVDDFHFKVIAYENNVIKWQGFVSTGNYSEPYEQTPFPVTITCDCGLKQLKNVLYDNAGTYYNGRRQDSQIILDILGKLGITTFIEFVNIYEATMNSTVNDSPLDQTLPDVDVFKDKYCDEVLSETLKKYNAIIVHDKGTFKIYRPIELINATVYGRIFTDVITKSSISFAPAQLINRIGYSSHNIQVPGGALMIERPAKKVTINQDYGYKESWLDNWQFKPETWNGYDYDYWTRSSTPYLDVAPVSSLVPGEEGIALNAAGEYIYQVMGSHSIISTNDLFVFEFDFAFMNNRGFATVDPDLYIKITQGAHFLELVDDTYLAWTTVDSRINISPSIPEFWTPWVSFKRLFPQFLENGPIEVRLYSSAYQYCWACYKNVKFYTTNSKTIAKRITRTLRQRIVFSHGTGSEFVIDLRDKYYTVKLKEEIANIVEHQYIKTNAINGNDLDYDYILGDVLKTSSPVSDADTDIDNILEQFAGSLATSKPRYRVDSVELTGSSGTADIFCNNRGASAIWNTSLNQTAINFVTANAAWYAAGTPAITVSANTHFIIFTSNVLGADFTGLTSVQNTGYNLYGLITYSFPSRSLLNLIPTTAWNTRGGSENKPLLEIIGDEIADQYSYPKQLIQMPIREDANSVSGISLLGNYEDALNYHGGVVRKFVFNRGEWSAKFRKWIIDLIEIL